MKTKNIPKRNLILTTLMLFAFVGLMSSCSKSSDSYGMNTSTTTTPSNPNQVLIQGMAFTPKTLTVSVNTTVTWTNNDAVAHTVTSSTGLFNSSSLATNATFSYTFTTAGTYAYACSIHPSMTGTVVVNP